MSQSDNSKTPNGIISSKPKILEDGKETTKQTIRKKVWNFMDHNAISAFPRPVYGRIPNFKGCEDSANKLLEMQAYVDSKIVEVNPDKPQEPARILCLMDNKTLYVPVPRLKEGLLKQVTIPETDNPANITLKQLVSRKGIDEAGKLISLTDNIHIDLLVLGSVAVSKEGYRIGKGRGYADLEYAILKEMNAVDENTVVVTNVHDCQVFDILPKELFKEHDVPVDYILTPTEIINVTHSIPKPRGIIWNIISQRKVNLMPILQELKKEHEGKDKDTTLKDVDSDVESYEPRYFNRSFKYPRRRLRSYGRASESQGEGDAVQNRSQFRQRYFRRRKPQNSEEPTTGNVDASGSSELEKPRTTNKNNERKRSFRRNKPPIDFSLIVSNIEKTVRVRDLKNALIERGIKPSDITWRGYKGFCYLHYAKPSPKTNTIEPRQVDNVIEILQAMKICPDSDSNLDVKVLEKISRIETTDVTAV